MLLPESEQKFINYYQELSSELLGIMPKHLQAFQHGDFPPEDQKPNLIVVTHVAVNTPAFLKALSKIARIRAVIPKGSIRQGDVLEQLRRDYPLREDVNKTLLKDPVFAQKLIDETVPNGQSFIIADHGGYFHGALPELAQHYEGRLTGVSESTLNGQDKHDSSIHKLNVPVISIAQTAFKKVSDDEIGKRIVDALKGPLISADNRDISRYTIGIIGYGTIGSAVSRALQDMHVNPLVLDLSEEQKLRTKASGADVCDETYLLKHSDLIICAATSKVLSARNFKHIKPGAKIAMCTSMDDQVDIAEMKAMYHKEKGRSSSMETYVANDESDHRFHLVLGGKAVNFSLPGAGDTIALVEGGRIADIIELAQGRNKPRPDKGHNTIQKYLDPGADFLIMHLWGKHFKPTLHADMPSLPLRIGVGR